MSSILLGPLANSNKQNILNSVYSSDISGQIKFMENQQARQNFSKPEYLRQFDDLSFDNISEPVGVNESYNTIKGINSSLQRGLDFQNGYSNFQKTDMHYDVVTKESFTHNNMVPSTSRRDFSNNLAHADRAQRKLQVFSGVDPNYVPKKEKVPLFEPLPDLTWVNGMPVIADKLVNRYLPSNKNNYGNLPFQNNVRVRPGIEFQNQEGNYAVYRVNPRDIDSLRSDINKKVSYENKPLETIKKGELRGPDPSLSKFKLPDFREIKFEDLVSSRAHIDAPKQTGTYTNVTSQRNEKETYYSGPAINRNVGNGPDKNKTRFEPAKKESYYNDPSHAINAVYQKPVMTNANSWTNYENQRATTNIQYEGLVSNAVIGGGSNYTVDYKDVPLTTLRELMIYGDNNIGVVGSQQQGNYIFSNDMILPVTNRQTTSHDIALNVKGIETQAPIYNQDPAKITLRQNTSHNIVSNVRGDEKNVPLYNNDMAKATLRPGTNHNIVTNIRGEEKNAPIYNQDEARLTIRQGTSHDMAINVAPTEVAGYTELADNARNTIKESVMFTVPEVNIKGYINDNYVTLQDEARPTVKQTTLVSNRPTGSISNAYGNYTRDVNDSAKITTRQTTEDTKYIGHVNHHDVEATYARDINDEARPTIKQTTLYTTPGGRMNNSNMGNYARDINDEAKSTIKQTTLFATPGGRMNNTNMGNYTRDNKDEARVTTKQTTLLQDYTGGLRGEIDAQVSHDASNNMEIDDRRQISTYNRAPNAKGDLHGPYIDADNVRMNNRRDLYCYVAHPHKPLDMSVMPTTSRDTIENIYSMSKPVIETSTYYVNPYFINTLKNNPLVNDIYHQKNV